MSRVLYIPHTSSPGNLNTDHTYGWATAFFKTWIEKDKNVKVYWPVPRGALTDQKDAFYKFTDEEMKNNFKFFEVDIDAEQVIEQAKLQREIVDMFSMYTGQYHFDIIFCEKPAVLGLFLGESGYAIRDRRTKTILGNVHFAMDANSCTGILIPRELEMTYFSNLSCCDGYLFACGETCFIDGWGQFSKKLSKNFAPSLHKEIAKRPRWVKPTSDMKELKKVYESWDGKKGDGFRVHYGFSESSNFSHTKVCEVIKAWQMLDDDVLFVTTTPGGGESSSKAVKEGLKLESHYACSRRKFFDIAIRSHCYIMWTVYGPELNHGSCIEMARLGVVPVFSEKAIPYPWTSEYPFTFRNDAELIAVLKFIKGNYDGKKVQDVILKNQKMLDDLYESSGHNAIIDGVLEMREKALQSHNVPFFYKDVVENAPSPITFEKLCDFISENSVKKADIRKFFVGAASYRNGKRDAIREYMLQSGWEDIGTIDEVIFKKKGT